MMAFKSIQVGDIVTNSSRFWRVVGVRIGVVGVESLVDMVPLDRDHDLVLVVPHDLIPHSAIYRAVDHEAARAA